MVNIIIPAYNAHKTIRQAVASVAVQDDQENIKLTIVDDCSDKPYDYLLDDFKYLNINILRKPFNSGPGQARQYGIDRTDCEYLIFLDADDCLYCSDAVKKLLNTIKYGNYDLVSSVFLEETSNNANYFVHQQDLVWMHGKIYRTKYIKKRSIKFNETRMNEDSAFNMIISNANAKIYFVEYATYIWKNNKNSITRSRDFLSDSIGDFIINGEYTLNELIRLNAPKNNILSCILQYLISLYIYYLTFINQKKEEIYLNNFISNVKNYYKKATSNVTNVLTEEQFGEVFYNHFLINEFISRKIIMKISIYDFINMIKSE